MRILFSAFAVRICTKGIFSNTTFWSKSADDRFHFFPGKSLIFHAHCLLRWQPAWNVKHYFMCNIRKYISGICWKVYITKTCLYNFDPFKPHFYIVKLGFTGVYIIFLISAQNIDCGYSLEPPCRGGSNEYPQSMFWSEIWKISEFFVWKFSCFGGKVFE